MDDALAPEATAANHGDEAGSLEPDPKLVLLADRAVAAGLTAGWRRPRNLRTGEPQDSYWLDIEMRSGRRVRHLHIFADHAEILAPFTFERWTALGDYQAILDADNRVIVAEVSLRRRLGASLRKLVGAESRDTSRLTVQSPNSDLSLELHSHCPPEIAALKGRRDFPGEGLTIRGVTATRHDEALELLLDLSTSFFIDLDIGYGITASLVKGYDAELVVQDGYDLDPPNTVVPRFPNARHNRDAAALYLYARSVTQTPLLEYLVYYQVIEFYLPTYTRSATITRVRNILKDPAFDYNNDLALGRLLETVAPTGKKVISEREQVATTIAYCVDDAAIAAFLDDRPAAAKALADKNRIRSVRVVSVNDRQTPLISQVAERIYDLRCRIVHSKDGGYESEQPIRPSDRESHLMRHDLSLIRFIAQRVLIASSRPASW